MFFGRRWGFFYMGEKRGGGFIRTGALIRINFVRVQTINIIAHPHAMGDHRILPI